MEGQSRCGASTSWSFLVSTASSGPSAAGAANVASFSGASETEDGCGPATTLGNLEPDGDASLSTRSSFALDHELDVRHSLPSRGDSQSLVGVEPHRVRLADQFSNPAAKRDREGFEGEARRRSNNGFGPKGPAPQVKSKQIVAPQMLGGFIFKSDRSHLLHDRRPPDRASSEQSIAWVFDAAELQLMGAQYENAETTLDAEPELLDIDSPEGRRVGGQPVPLPALPRAPPRVNPNRPQTTGQIVDGGSFYSGGNDVQNKSPLPST